MVSDVKPQIAVPMHGLDDEQKEFKQLVDVKMPDIGTTDLIPNQFHRWRSISKSPVSLYHFIQKEKINLHIVLLIRFGWIWIQF